MFCLDTIFWHKDRNLWNYGIVVNEENDSMKLAPSHDNSHVLYLQKGEKYIEEMIFSIINGNRLENVSASSFGVEMDDSIEQLVNFYSGCDEDIRQVIDKLIDEIDVEKVVEEVKNVCMIGDIGALWVKAVLNYRRITVLNRLESAKIDGDKALKPNVSFNKRK